jgi:hypothetical protein
VYRREMIGPLIAEKCIVMIFSREAEGIIRFVAEKGVVGKYP